MGTIQLRKGDDLPLRAAFTSDGQAYPMDGWTVEGTLSHKGYRSQTTVPVTITWVDQSAGIAAVTLTEVETMALPAGDHDLQLRATSPDGISTSTIPSTVKVRD